MYSTKEFPGLRASTDLTKVRHLLFFYLRTLPNTPVSLSLSYAYVQNKQHLSYFGVRLNLRETERKRRKKVDDPLSVSTVGAGGTGAGSGATKGKRRDDEESGYED